MKFRTIILLPNKNILTGRWVEAIDQDQADQAMDLIAQNLFLGECGYIRTEDGMKMFIPKSLMSAAVLTFDLHQAPSKKTTTTKPPADRRGFTILEGGKKE